MDVMGYPEDVGGGGIEAEPEAEGDFVKVMLPLIQPLELAKSPKQLPRCESEATSKRSLDVGRALEMTNRRSAPPALTSSPHQGA